MFVVSSWYLVLVSHKDAESEFQKLYIIVIFMHFTKAKQPTTPTHSISKKKNCLPFTDIGLLNS